MNETDEMFNSMYIDISRTWYPNHTNANWNCKAITLQSSSREYLHLCAHHSSANLTGILKTWVVLLEGLKHHFVQNGNIDREDIFYEIETINSWKMEDGIEVRRRDSNINKVIINHGISKEKKHLITKLRKLLLHQIHPHVLKKFQASS